MADERVIPHRAFDKVVDATYLDLEDIPQSPITTLDECRNLTPFRKLGALKQMCGFASVKANADLPNPTNYGLSGYKPVDMYVIGLDKDQKEIYLLIYKNSSNLTRFFISPWYNPNAFYSNYNPEFTQETWQTGWMELTERYDTTITVTGANTLTFTAGTNPILNANYRLNNFFIINTTQDASFLDRASKHNYIINHTYSAPTHTLTLKGNITGWAGRNWTTGDTCTIVRFPCVYYYKIQPNSLANAGASFDGLPTDYSYKDGQLRIACGKDNKPLILDFIQNRSYLLGNDNSMSYEGFWFDFQSLLPKQKHSACTAWATRTDSAAGTAFDIDVNGSNQLFWDTSGNGQVRISPVSGNFRLKVYAVTSALYISWKANGDVVELVANKMGVFHGWMIVIVDNITLTIADFVNGYNSNINPLYGISYATSTGGADFVNVQNQAFFQQNLQIKEFSGTTGFTGHEAGKNSLAENPIIGARLFMEPCSVNEIGDQPNVQRNVLIVNLVYDNRSQVLLGHGTYDTTQGFEIQFTLWFSRRLTGISVFNQSTGYSGTGNVNSYVIETEVYPYYKWKQDFFTTPLTTGLRINEIKHFTQYDFYDFTKGVNGQLADKISNVSDNTIGQNAYTFTNKTVTYTRGDTNNTLYSHCWFVQFNNTNQQIATDGKGTKFVAKCNRYIDQDTTMNYERTSFVGQTNGRFFLIGIKNTIEEKPFESNDIVCYNIYAGAVSEYDTFLHDRFMPVAFGDKDRLRAIENYNGYLFLAKDNNSFALEVNTDNELKYRVIDTKLGRGILDPRFLLQTPYGLVMPTRDGVWLITQDGSEPIMTPSNGKLDLYKSLFNSNSGKDIVYNKKYNELFLMFKRTNDPNDYTTYIFTYNFNEQKWGGYYYFTFNNASGIVGTCPFVLRENTSGDIVFFNFDDSNLANFRIDSFSDTSFVFIEPDASTFSINWLMKTHFTPYSGRLKDSRLIKVSLIYNAISTSGAKNVTLKIYKDDLTSTSYTINVTTGNVNLANQIKECLLKADGIGSTVAFSIENSTANNFSDFSINGVNIWIAEQTRKQIT